jgi:hypothetical protein
MKTSIQALIAIILVILVILGIYTAGSTVFDSAGGNIEEGGNESGIRMDCIFKNPQSADSACRTRSELNLVEKDVREV